MPRGSYKIPCHDQNVVWQEYLDHGAVWRDTPEHVAVWRGIRDPGAA